MAKTATETTIKVSAEPAADAPAMVWSTVINEHGCVTAVLVPATAGAPADGEEEQAQ